MTVLRTLSLLGSTLAVLAAQMVHAEQWPEAVQAFEKKGLKIVGRFDAPNGLQGFAARYQGQGVAMYLTADGKNVLIGSLYDVEGNDLSKAPLDKLVYQPMGKEMWQRLERSTWIVDGAADAPRVVYVIADPNCPYCSMFWKQARPWVDAGKVQLRHVLVGILREDSAGKAAAILSSKSPQTALNNHEAAGKDSNIRPLGRIPDSLSGKLAANLVLMQDLGAAATPAIFYMEGDRLQQHQGAPRGETLEKILGPLPKS
ncbi:thiol:disulfide interchange protein DsbG [Ectopseudomonas mendocina]|uniref:Thiol:disulfide interchange protein n=1 Tax=Ectopseudomonas mendocina TaxID=300 RepID=A0ABZ2RDA3_ECTME